MQLVKLGELHGLSPVAERGARDDHATDDGHPFAGVSQLFVGLHVERQRAVIYSCSGAAVCKTVSVGRAINGATEHDQKQGGKTMLKKLFVTAAAAAALTVPLAGVAGADPAPDNPGVPGNIPGPDSGLSPGSVISGAAKLEGSVPDVWITAPGGYRNPGQNLKDCCLPH